MHRFASAILAESPDLMTNVTIVKRKDEEKYNGDYRTKRVILEIYDAFRQPRATDPSCRTSL